MNYSNAKIDSLLQSAEFWANRRHEIEEAKEEAFQKFWATSMPEETEETAREAYAEKQEEEKAARQYDDIVWENNYNDRH